MKYIQKIRLISETPLGTLPVLEYDGMKLSQSVTVCRFLAEEFGIAGKTNREKAMANMIVDTIVDVQIGKAEFLILDYIKKLNKIVKYSYAMN